MLILRDKIILADGKPVKLYSFDGKLWFSKPRDIAEFKQRRARVKADLQHTFASHDVTRHIASGIVDFWGA
jgi:hypothetical protein